MGAPFTDITLYSPTIHSVSTPAYYQETCLKNYVSDLYVQKMYGYKPPTTTRVTLQPSFYGIWNKTRKDGSLISMAPFYDREQYEAFDKRGKYKYILDIIHTSMLQLSEEYNWNKEVFENAYKEIIDNDFEFVVRYPPKKAKDKKKVAEIIIEKTESTTTVYVSMQMEGQCTKQKLFDKKNWYWYDEAYKMAKHSKWFDNNRFGIYIKNLNFAVWYSINDRKVSFEVNGTVQENYNLKRMFTQY